MNKVRNQKLLKDFGTHLRKVRSEKGMTQEELAYSADVPISQIGRIERGEVNATISSLYAMAKAVKTSLKDLVDF